MKPTEQRLAERLKKGDAAALGKIIDAFSGYVCTVIRNFSRGTLSEQDIDELCSDVFYRLWQKRDNLDAELGLKAYLSAIARNAVKNRFRAQKPPAEDISELELAEDFSIEELAERRELMRALCEALETLSDAEREVFLRFYFYGEKSSEIAIKTGAAESSVRSKLSRTRTKLREYLTERGFE
ncbi:MAG: sigma-70 family RNA polymerase sigma factor, partial [Oscillospiraceae bacterium]|nr:sigma-70 family RNA polymerase sigma factor [Oscillospiraceae bacterium]